MVVSSGPADPVQAAACFDFGTALCWLLTDQNQK
jgi:hypothetical protein